MDHDFTKSGQDGETRGPPKLLDLSNEDDDEEESAQLSGVVQTADSVKKASAAHLVGLEKRQEAALGVSAEKSGSEPKAASKERVGDVGMSNSSFLSSEHSSPVKRQKSNFTNRKQPSIKLAIDIVSINNQFNFGGEKGELKPEEQESKLETDIMELAARCVAAMRRAKKNKPKTRFNQLLAQEMQQNDEELTEEDNERVLEGEEDPDDENNEDGSSDQTNLLSTGELRVRDQMAIELAKDSLQIRGVTDQTQMMDDMSQAAQIGDVGDQGLANQTL